MKECPKLVPRIKYNTHLRFLEWLKNPSFPITPHYWYNLNSQLGEALPSKEIPNHGTSLR